MGSRKDIHLQFFWLNKREYGTPPTVSEYRSKLLVAAKDGGEDFLSKMGDKGRKRLRRKALINFYQFRIKDGGRPLSLADAKNVYNFLEEIADDGTISDGRVGIEPGSPWLASEQQDPVGHYKRREWDVFELSGAGKLSRFTSE